MGLRLRLPVRLPRLSENIGALNESFPRNNRHFGERYGKTKTYVIYSDNPEKSAKQFFKMIAKNGYAYPIDTGYGRGLRANLGDGSIVILRLTTSVSDSPAVSIDVSRSDEIAVHGLVTQKIHFERRK